MSDPKSVEKCGRCSFLKKGESLVDWVCENCRKRFCSGCMIWMQMQMEFYNLDNVEGLENWCYDCLSDKRWDNENFSFKD